MIASLSFSYDKILMIAKSNDAPVSDLQRLWWSLRVEDSADARVGFPKRTMSNQKFALCNMYSYSVPW